MSKQYYRFVISIPGSGARVSEDTWSTPQQAREKGKQFAEEHGLNNYKVSDTPSDNPRPLDGN